MAQSNHVGSVSRHHTPAQGLQLSDGDAPNLEEVDVTQDATQRRSTPDRADADASEDDSNSDVASTQRSTQIKDETQNTQAMNRDASDEHVPDNESEAEDGNDDRVNSQVHEEPSEDAQDRPSERALALRELSWEDLQQRFQDEMAKKTGEEEALKQEFQQYTEVDLLRPAFVPILTFAAVVP